MPGRGRIQVNNARLARFNFLPSRFILRAQYTLSHKFSLLCASIFAHPALPLSDKTNSHRKMTSEAAHLSIQAKANAITDSGASGCSRFFLEQRALPEIVTRVVTAATKASVRVSRETMQWCQETKRDSTLPFHFTSSSIFLCASDHNFSLSAKGATGGRKLDRKKRKRDRDRDRNIGISVDAEQAGQRRNYLLQNIKGVSFVSLLDDNVTFVELNLLQSLSDLVALVVGERGCSAPTSLQNETERKRNPFAC